MDLSRFPDDFEHVPSHDAGEPDSKLNDILKGIDGIFGPEQPDDPSDHPDISSSDGRTTPIVSSISGPGEGAKRNIVRSRASSSPLPRPPPSPLLPPQSPTVPPRTKKQSSVGKAWHKFKKVLAKKFGGGDQSPPKLSDKLAPERDDEVKWFETLFPKSPKPQKPAKTRK